MGIHSLILTWYFLKIADHCKGFQWKRLVTSLFSGSLCQGVKDSWLQRNGYKFLCVSPLGKRPVNTWQAQKSCTHWHSKNSISCVFLFFLSQRNDQTHILESRLINSYVDSSQTLRITKIWKLMSILTWHITTKIYSRVADRFFLKKGMKCNFVSLRIIRLF